MAKNSYADIKVSRGTKQNFTDLFRQYPKGILHEDTVTYATTTFTMSVNEVNQQVTIFGEMAEVISKLLNGQKTGSVKTVFERSRCLVEPA